MKRILATGALIAGSLFAMTAAAQPDPNATAATQRKAAFQLLSYSNGPLGQMARGGDVDAATTIASLENMIVIANMLPGLFSTDTRGSGVETRALDSIWDNKDDFDSLAADLAAGAQAAIDMLAADPDSGRQAMGQVGPKCGACHDRYRAE
jgi:cytochrome c556